MAFQIIDDVDTTTLPNVQEDGGGASNGLIPITLPETDADGALLIPTTGPEQKFNISGTKTGTENELSIFIAKLKKWVNDGGKLSKANLTYVSTLDGASLSIRATNYNKRWGAGKPRILHYSLELIEGSFT